MHTIIAIDPGKDGGIAVRFSEYKEAYPMPDTFGDIIDLLRSIYAPSGNIVCYLEKVSGFAGKGRPGAHMFKFGEGFGFLQGVIMSASIKLVLVRPQEWQKHFALGTAAACTGKREWKNKLKAEAQRRYPRLDVTLKTADALLLLDYAIAKEDGRV